MIYIDVLVLISLFSYHVDYMDFLYYYIYVFLERVGAEVVECACVIELPELKVCVFCISQYFVF